MTETRRIARSAGIALLERKGIALVKSTDAAAFLAAVHAAGARILAIDGFTVRGAIIEAEPDIEADFTEIDELDEIAGEAADFLGQFAPDDDLHFEFVLDDE